MKNAFIPLPLAFVLIVLAIPSALQGAVLVEQAAGTGALPGTAQVFDINAIDSILGDLSPAAGANPANTVDMFAFTALNPFFFSAVTIPGAFNVADPQLFLFDSSGVGVLFNNDRSLVPSDTQAELATALYAAGTYYLAISLFAVDPVDAIVAYLFDSLGSNGGGPVNANPVADWLDTGSANVFDSDTYDIALQFTQVPEPATSGMALLAVGAMLAWRKR